MATAIDEIVARLAALERRLDRQTAARVLSAPIGNADVAAGAGIAQSKLAPLVIGNSEVGVGGLHPNRLSSWSGGTYANHVLYDHGAGISVAKVGDAFVNVGGLSPNRIHGGGTANRVLRTSDGVNSLMGQIQTLDMAFQSISGASAAFLGADASTTSGSFVTCPPVVGHNVASWNSMIVVLGWMCHRNLTAGQRNFFGIGVDGAGPVRATFDDDTTNYHPSFIANVWAPGSLAPGIHNFHFSIMVGGGTFYVLNSWTWLIVLEIKA